MTNLDKFYSEMKKNAARHARDGSYTQLSADLERGFLEWTRSFGSLGENLAYFWRDRYGDSLETEEGRLTALDRLASLLALVSGDFDETMDFPDSEWQEIREIVSGEADSLDIDTLTDIMSVIVSRGKV